MGERRKPQAELQIPDTLLADLRGYVTAREIERGLDCLASNSRLIMGLGPVQANAAQLLVLLAIWSDIGFNGSPPVRELLPRFDSSARSQLSISDYICLRMCQGMLAMAEEAVEKAIGHFDFVLGLSEELNSRFLLSISYYWKGRCLRRRGDYDEALIYTGQGRDIALELGHPRMAAVMQVLESWLLFQRGQWKEAVRVSDRAEAVLRETDDYVTLGNIESLHGRMARRQGRFDQAIERFNRANEYYRRRDPEHPNLARSLANMALAKRGIALQLQRRVDLDAQRRRKKSIRTGRGGSGQTSATMSPTDHRRRLTELRREALEDLKAAREIYQRRPTHHGLGTVYLNAAYIHLDSGDFQRAEEESASAYQLGEEKQDYILMGRARIVQCMVENAKVEEGIGSGSDAGFHARRAHDFSQEAIQLAKHTQHHHLLATAHLWQGLTQCNSFFDNLESARESYDLARAACGPTQPDSIWQELQGLRSRILRKGSVDPTLKAWSQGAVGEKSFRQINEEFADIVISRVWEREGRKVSRVAQRLSISPKKVRRILGRVGRRKPKAG